MFKETQKQRSFSDNFFFPFRGSTLTTKIMIIFFLFAALQDFTPAFAENSNGTSLQVWEISEMLLTGMSDSAGTLVITCGPEVVVQTEIVAGNFTAAFDHPIRPSRLQLTFRSDEGKETTTSVDYQPALAYSLLDAVGILAGQANPDAILSATYLQQVVPLVSLEKTTGKFSFSRIRTLKTGERMILTSEFQGIRSVSTVNAQPAPAPKAPLISPVSNKDTFFSGKGTPYTTVVFSNASHTYRVELNENPSFKINLGKPLTAGSVIIGYSIDSQKRKSPTVSQKVLDKIAPFILLKSKWTNKVLSVRGLTEPLALVSLKTATKHIRTVKADRFGNFTLTFPMQKSGTTQYISGRDPSGNTGVKQKIIVGSSSRASSKLIQAPIVRQMPELPRGCEVTSLSMLLQHAGINVSKMTLAAQVKKEGSPYRISNGKIYFGNPANGFVGAMDTLEKPGFGVYHQPVAELASRYLPGRIVNLTGSHFDSVLDYVSSGRPVWIVTTSWFKPVPITYWKTWYTPTGPVRITMKEHSVVITGYNKQNVYFNDPLDGYKNKKKPIKSFIEGWKQFGSQAITYF